MNNPNRQQSLEAARRGYHFLRLYIESQIVDARIRAEIVCLLDEFERLDANAQKVRRKRIENPKKATVYQRRWRDKPT
jgi:hypothetical protein